MQLLLHCRPNHCEGKWRYRGVGGKGTEKKLNSKRGESQNQHHIYNSANLKQYARHEVHSYLMLHILMLIATNTLTTFNCKWLLGQSKKNAHRTLSLLLSQSLNCSHGSFFFFEGDRMQRYEFNSWMECGSTDLRWSPWQVFKEKDNKYTCLSIEVCSLTCASVYACVCLPSYLSFRVRVASVKHAEKNREPVWNNKGNVRLHTTNVFLVIFFLKFFMKLAIINL